MGIASAMTHAMMVKMKMRMIGDVHPAKGVDVAQDGVLEHAAVDVA